MAMSRLPLWQRDWDAAEEEWRQKELAAAEKQPLKGFKNLPQMVGITQETAKQLKWKSLKWMIQKDENYRTIKALLKHPLKYAWGYFKSIRRKKSYEREGDFFLYGVRSLSAFAKLLENPNALFVLGFSYCHKPFECPSKRFSPDCIHDPDHLVCQQCFIGKAAHAVAPGSAILLFIPTVHYIGEKVLEIVHQNPGKEVLFMISACEMTLEMFGDFGNMVGIRGVGIRLDGRICNTMKAFELSEQGIKPGMTVILEETKKQVLSLIRARNRVFA